MKTFACLALSVILMTSVQAQTIVERLGHLKVDGNRIKDACGRVAQVKGMSFFWSQWEGNEHYNANAVRWLRDDWNVQVVRAALAVRGASDDYIGSPQVHLNRVTAVLDGAVQHGVYGIADFHAHYADNYTGGAATTFFRTISQRYAGRPNIIYEIWNEPTGDYGDAGGRVMWKSIKAYAREIIAVIRDNDPNGLIVVGTPFYDQRPDLAAEDPLTVDSKGRPVGNVAYTIHAYAGAHRQQIRDYGQRALDRGLALFMTETGRDGTNYGPNNNIDPAEWNVWEAWMDQRGISYAKWSMSTKNETGSSLQPGAPANGGWTDAQLRPEGRWNRSHFRAVNASPPAPCGTSPTPPPAVSKDEISAVSAPQTVAAGSNVDVKVDYAATSNRDVRVVFQLKNPPYTVYAENKLDVRAGSGSVTTSVNVPANVPPGKGMYQFQTFMTADGGSWSTRISNLPRADIDVVAAPSPEQSRTVRVYEDGIVAPWSDWSWGGVADVDDGLAKAGSYAYKYNFSGNGAISFRHPYGVSGQELVGIEFWARTWGGSASVVVKASHDDNFANASTGKVLTVDSTYRQFQVAKADLGNFNWYRRFFLQTNAGPSIFVDDVRLIYR
jgi:endoglucanase